MKTRIWPAAAAAALLLTLAAPGRAAPPLELDRKLQQALQALDAAINANDCKTVIKLGEPLLAARRGKLPSDLEAELESLVADCAYETDAKTIAYAHALAGTRLAEASDPLWRMRLYLEMEAKKYGPAVATVEAMSQGRGAALNTTPMTWLYRLDREMKEAGLKAERKRLLKVLTGDGYVPTESVGDAQSVHLTYATLLAEEGDAAGARAMLATVLDPELLMEAMFDPRISPLLPANLDLRAAAERSLAADRALAEAHPDRLDPLLTVARTLRLLGRPNESLALIEPVLARPDVLSAFSDAKDKLSWAWDEAARSNALLGRYPEAAKAMAAGAAVNESGTPNVSQLLNLAHLQLRFGHPEEVLKTLAGFDGAERHASPYGLMVMHLARGCANRATGREAAAAADLAYMRAHEKDNPDNLGFLYICLDRLDDAAALFIRGLEDPDRRASVLRIFSDYDPPPGPMPDIFAKGVAALKARPDLKAALAKAGGTRRIPLQDSNL